MSIRSRRTRARAFFAFRSFAVGILLCPGTALAGTTGETIAVLDTGLDINSCYFVEPDGSVWDCPSDRRIAATPPARRRSIRGGDARTLFAARPACTDCSLFSRDCVNMWPLALDMPRLLGAGAGR